LLDGLSVSNDVHAVGRVPWQASVKSFCVDDNLMNVVIVHSYRGSAQYRHKAIYLPLLGNV